MSILSDLTSNLGLDIDLNNEFTLEKNDSFITPISSPYFQPFKFGNVQAIKSNFIRDEFIKGKIKHPSKISNSSESRKETSKKKSSQFKPDALQNPKNSPHTNANVKSEIIDDSSPNQKIKKPQDIANSNIYKTVPVQDKIGKKFIKKNKIKNKKYSANIF
ncbi:hypothetical protein AYI69_g700 [Smittium culicis]|uniref:Uncharacterized protein n=1 Tax=Smittium culicis TaxID=133412 RepID=A0A1R1YSA1_9FUNG|nr:hypothetical protein AYI69_g700 [Smittium culicis]